MTTATTCSGRPVVAQALNCPDCRFANRLSRPSVSRNAASGSPSRSRSPHTNSTAPLSSGNGCVGVHVPSALFWSAAGPAVSEPSKTSRSPSISRSATHTPRASATTSGSLSLETSGTGWNVPASVCSSSTRPPPCVTTMSFRKSLFQSKARNMVGVAGSPAPSGISNDSPVPIRRNSRSSTATIAGVTVSFDNTMPATDRVGDPD